MVRQRKNFKDEEKEEDGRCAAARLAIFVPLARELVRANFPPFGPRKFQPHFSFHPLQLRIFHDLK